MEAYVTTLGVRLLALPYHLDIEYTYYVPETLDGEHTVGEFVLVPFGGANKRHTALVTSVSRTNDYQKLKPILSVINESLTLDAEMMALACFLCDRTLCTMGDAVRRLIPADALSRADECFFPVPGADAEDAAINRKAKDLFDFIASHKNVTRKRLEKDFGTDIRSTLKILREKGLILTDTVIKEPKTGAVEEIAVLLPEADSSVLLRPRTPDAHRKLFAEISEAGRIHVRTLTESGYTMAHIRALEKKGLILIEKQEVIRNHYADLDAKPEKIALTDEQSAAFETLRALMDENAPRAALLHGVTGSGKTQVILSLCEKAIEGGKTAIVLIPEIALTWQTVSVFTARFGKRIAVMHSGLTDGERFDAYKRIRRGEIDIVLGTRSAIFAPLPHIGLIVIDEEQETAYKSDMSPKYHARDIAKHRAAAHGALLLMASATPAVESYYEAKSGKYTLVQMKKRYTGAALPAVKIADMRLGKDTPDMDMIGGTLRALMQKEQENGKQSMLFLNRRGYNSVVSCRACGETIVCPNCSVSLTHHKTKKGAKLVCHYCGYHIPPPRYCAKCGSEHLAFEGYGTQLIEEEIEKFLPDARTLRMDADTTRERFSQDEITGAFGRHEADVLVGTQMIAKGHNFPDLSLVGVVAADASLFLDDFRANERTFSLITQVIGRAGRSTGGGTAVIQTLNPDNETIRLSAAQNYEAFYENEIALRRALVFPPFCDIAVFGFTADEEAELRRFAADFVTALKQIGEVDFPDVKMIVFGPFEAPIFKIKNKYRMRAVIKFKNNRRARALFARLLTEYGKKAGGKIGLSVDINPSST